MSSPYDDDDARWEREGDVPDLADPDESMEHARENVLSSWPEREKDIEDPFAEPAEEREVVPEPGTQVEPEPEPVPAAWQVEAVEPEREAEPDQPDDEPHALVATPAPATTTEHAPGELDVPPGIPVLEGAPRGASRAVGIVVSRFNGDVTSRLLQQCLDELTDSGVLPENVTVVPVPGAFELPLASIALAKTRRYACVIALGCVIRGDTPHFDYVASEAASGLQLAALETGVPVAFGVLTLDRLEQADERLEKGAEAARTGLEMADLFANLRAAAAR